MCSPIPVKCEKFELCDNRPFCCSRCLHNFNANKTNRKILHNFFKEPNPGWWEESRILVDTRELQGPIPKLLKRINVPYKVVTLEVGDYLIGEIPVERKEINDYIGSKTSGHLDTQLYNLSFHYPFSYLVIEGSITEALMTREIRRAQFISSLLGSSLKRSDGGKQGIIVTVQLNTPWDTALFLKFLYNKIVKGETVRIPQIKRVKADPNNLLIHVASQLPGVGEKRAKILLQNFGSLRNLFNAEPREISVLKGFSDNSAMKIWNFVNMEYKEEP